MRCLVCYYQFFFSFLHPPSLVNLKLIQSPLFSFPTSLMCALPQRPSSQGRQIRTSLVLASLRWAAALFSALQMGLSGVAKSPRRQAAGGREGGRTALSFSGTAPEPVHIAGSLSPQTPMSTSMDEAFLYWIARRRLWPWHSQGPLFSSSLQLRRHPARHRPPLHTSMDHLQMRCDQVLLYLESKGPAQRCLTSVMQVACR